MSSSSSSSFRSPRASLLSPSHSPSQSLSHVVDVEKRLHTKELPQHLQRDMVEWLNIVTVDRGKGKRRVKPRSYAAVDALPLTEEAMLQATDWSDDDFDIDEVEEFGSDDSRRSSSSGSSDSSSEDSSSDSDEDASDDSDGAAESSSGVDLDELPAPKSPAKRRATAAPSPGRSSKKCKTRKTSSSKRTTGSRGRGKIAQVSDDEEESDDDDDDDDDGGVYTVEKVIGKDIDPSGQVLYLVKWEGYPDDQSTWEPEGNIYDKSVIHDFEQGLSPRKKSKKAKANRKKAS